MNEELLKFIVWVTGHDEETVSQMYNDYSSSPQAKIIPVGKRVSTKTADEIAAIVKDVLAHQQMLVHNRLEKDKTPIRLGYQASIINIIEELISKDELLKKHLTPLLENDSRFSS